MRFTDTFFRELGFQAEGALLLQYIFDCHFTIKNWAPAPRFSFQRINGFYLIYNLEWNTQKTMQFDQFISLFNKNMNLSCS